MKPTRISSDQAKLIFGQQRVPGKRAPHVPKRREELPENIVAKQITDFLKLKAWRLYRQHVGAYVPYYAAMQAFKEHRDPSGSLVRIGEPGMPDWRAERPDARETGLMHVIHLEVKAPGEKPRDNQVEWMRKATATGTCAVWFASFETFLQWYKRTFPGEVTR